MVTSPVGLVPAAGMGTRFQGLTIKELHPVPVPIDGLAGPSCPQPICQIALGAVRGAGAEQCAVVVSARKADNFARVIGNRTPLGLSVSYVVQGEPLGLANAVSAASRWLGSNDVVLALPDTVHFPSDALRQAYRALVHNAMDVVLGVFPVERAEEFGPVEVSPDGTVQRIHDKPVISPVANTWGVAAWSPRFTEFCVAWDADPTRIGATERALGPAFEAARQAGLAVGALVFPNGEFGDIGTPRGREPRYKLRVPIIHGPAEALAKEQRSLMRIAVNPNGQRPVLRRDLG